ncbi:hypothetical protein bmyco0003_53920 [Bacillus pseudomycoides]|nr:hypothetical protein bmyco0003_53920 [Bacillus pseudomycoides]
MGYRFKNKLSVQNFPDISGTPLHKTKKSPKLIGLFFIILKVNFLLLVYICISL